MGTLSNVVKRLKKYEEEWKLLVGRPCQRHHAPQSRHSAPRTLAVALSAVLEQQRNISRVADVQDDHDGEHEHCVKDVQEDLMPEQIPRVALNVLDDSED